MTGRWGRANLCLARETQGSYPDGPKNIFRNVYGYVAKMHRKRNRATFVDGHNEIAICDAVLKSAKTKKW